MGVRGFNLNNVSITVAVLVLPPVVDHQSCATQPPSMMVLREDKMKIRTMQGCIMQVATIQFCFKVKYGFLKM